MPGLRRRSRPARSMRCSSGVCPAISSRGVLLRGAEVGGDDGRVALDLRGRALGDLLAEVQHDDAVGDAHDELHVVLDEQHAHAALGVDLLDQPGEVPLLDRVGARGRLVEQQHSRLGAQRPGDLQPALLAVGQRAGELVGPVRAAPPRRAERRRASVLSCSSRRCQGRPSIAETAPARCRVSTPILTFSSTVSAGNSRMFWNVRATPMRVDHVRLAAQHAGQRVAGPAGEQDLALLRHVHARSAS